MTDTPETIAADELVRQAEIALDEAHGIADRAGRVKDLEYAQWKQTQAREDSTW